MADDPVQWSTRRVIWKSISFNSIAFIASELCMYRLIGGMELTTGVLKLHLVIRNANALQLKVNLWH
jgi:hypothetical protein